MLIEADARRYITEAIELEKSLQALENKEKSKGRILLDTEEYHKIRKSLVKILGQINSVANPEGNGRDDLDVSIIEQAESVNRRVSST
jgi:hypothetical protein